MTSENWEKHEKDVMHGLHMNSYEAEQNLAQTLEKLADLALPNLSDVMVYVTDRQPAPVEGEFPAWQRYAIARSMTGRLILTEDTRFESLEPEQLDPTREGWILANADLDALRDPYSGESLSLTVRRKFSYSPKSFKSDHRLTYRLNGEVITPMQDRPIRVVSAALESHLEDPAQRAEFDSIFLGMMTQAFANGELEQINRKHENAMRPSTQKIIDAKLADIQTAPKATKLLMCQRIAEMMIFQIDAHEGGAETLPK